MTHSMQLWAEWIGSLSGPERFAVSAVAVIVVAVVLMACVVFFDSIFWAEPDEDEFSGRDLDVRFHAPATLQGDPRKGINGHKAHFDDAERERLGAIVAPFSRDRQVP